MILMIVVGPLYRRFNGMFKYDHYSGNFMLKYDHYRGKHQYGITGTPFFSIIIAFLNAIKLDPYSMSFVIGC